MFKNKLGLVSFLLCLTLISCQEKSFERIVKPSLEESLKLAKGNKKELEKVLKHYESLGDSLKLEAAKFLIINMPGNYTLDTTHLKSVRPIYKAFSHLSELDNQELNKRISNEWVVARRGLSKGNEIAKQDVEVIDSKYLINNIDLAFKSWQNNPLTKKATSFEDFCEYILPYRQKQGVCIEDWRSFFYKKHHSFFKKPHENIFTSIDSLSSEYKDMKWTQKYFNGLPFLKFQDLLYAKRCTCPQASWLNNMIYTANGIPVVNDFVPHWGNTLGDHAWNSLVQGEKANIFGPYDIDLKWVDVYNNKGEIPNADLKSPKIYRHCYSTNIDKPLLDKRVDINNIPSLFLNFKKQDVSRLYFDAHDVKFKLRTKIPTDTFYAYLAVFSKEKWEPIQYSEIIDGEVNFEGMGGGIVYLPVFFKKGNTISAGSPFYLSLEGKIKYFNPSSQQTNVDIYRKYPLSQINQSRANWFKGTEFYGANSADFRDEVRIKRIPVKEIVIHSRMNYVENIQSNKKFKYLKIKIPNYNWVAIAELEYYSGNRKLNGKPFSNTELSVDELKKINDGKIDNYISYPPHKKSWFAIEFDSPQKITKIGFCPRNDTNHILEGDTYELFYFRNGWNSLGKQKATDEKLNYNWNLFFSILLRQSK